MTVAVSKAVEEGAKAVICASTGNTSASAASYAARAGIPAVDSAAGGRGRARQARAGAGRSARACSRCAAASTRRSSRPASSPPAARTRSSTRSTRTGIEGQKTAVFEIVEELGGSTGRDLPPLRRRRQHDRLREGLRGARRHAVDARLGGGDRAARRRSPRRSASPSPVHRPEVARALGQTHGHVVSVSDDEILDCWRELATDEGMFCEPASAAGLAATEARAPRARRHGRRASSPATGSRIRTRPRGSPRPRSRSTRIRTRSQPPRSDPVRFRAPATTANLGPGVRLRRRGARPLERARADDLAGGGVRVEIEGEGADEIPRDASSTSASARSRCSRPSRASASASVNRIPLAARPRLERGDDRARARRGRARAGRQLAPEELLALALRAREPRRTTSPPASPAASRSPATAASRRIADSTPLTPIARRARQPGRDRGGTPRRYPRR